MELQQILDRMEAKAGETEKTAAATEPTDNQLQEALGEVLEEVTEKTAGEEKPETPVEGLMKQAEMIAGAEDSTEIGVDRLLEQASPEARNLLASIVADSVPDSEARDRELAEEIIQGIRSRRLKARRKRLKASMEQAKRAGDEATLARLLKEYQELR